MNTSAIQRFLAEKRSGSYRDSKGLDGWLMYDFRGSNPIAQSVAGVDDPGITRRWFCYIPSEGVPIWLVHRIEFFPFCRCGR